GGGRPAGSARMGAWAYGSMGEEQPEHTHAPIPPHTHTGPPAADALIEFTEALLGRLGIPLRLREVGFDREDSEWVAQETMPSGSTKANPRPVSVEEARALLEAAI